METWCKTHFYINRKEEAEKKAKMETEIQNLTNLLTENVQKNKNMETEIKKLTNLLTKNKVN